MSKWDLFVSIAIGVGLLASQGLGQAPARTERQVEQKADEALRKMSTSLAAARQFSFSVQVTSDDVVDSGQEIQFSNARRILVVRPNRVHVELSGDLDNGLAWYDGRTFATLDKNQGTYSITNVPEGLFAFKAPSGARKVDLQPLQQVKTFEVREQSPSAASEGK